MQRYRLPGYELKFLEKLQKQQNTSQFCDTLLQSDGISIPTHGCILAALSPYLSERLLASPSIPLGQKRHLKLDTVKAQTLLKLVALFYSGEVEVNKGVEQNDLLAAAIKFGITDLIEGQKQVGVDERCPQRGNCQSFWDSCEARQGVQDAHVQTEVIERRKSDTPVRAACPSVGAFGKTTSLLDQGGGPPEDMSAQNAYLSVMLTHQNLNIEDNSNILHSEQIPSSGSVSGDDSECNCSFNSITDCTAPCSVNVATTLFDRNSNSRLDQGGSDPLQSPALTDTMESGSEDLDTVADAAEESRTSAQQPKRAEVPEEERTKSTEERTLVGRKNLDLIKQMAQMVESTQISIKVKLVRTKGEVWEVAKMQNTDSMPVLSALKQTTLHSDSESSSLQSSPASKPGTPSIHVAAADASKHPPLLPPSTATTCLLGHDAALIQSGRPCLEESNEVLLGDIMMGLNILPSEVRSCMNPAYLQNRAQVVCPGQLPEEQQSRRDDRAAAGDAGRVYHQNCRTPVNLSSTHTDQTQSSSFSPSSQQHDAPQCRPPESFVSQQEPTSPTNTQTVESLTCSFALLPTLRPVTPTEYICGDLSTQDNEDIMELLPKAGRNGGQSSSSASLSTTDDLHLPQFLSPLRPIAAAGKPGLLFKGARPGCFRTSLNLDQLGQRLATENFETPPWTSSQMHTNVKCQRHTKTRVGNDHQTTSKDELRGSIAAQQGCKQRSLCRAKEAYIWQVRDGVQTQIHLNACSVSLSSNNVLARERELAVSSSGKSKGTQNVSADLSKMQTRGFLKKIQEATCKTKVENSFASKATVCVSEAVDNGEVVPIKRKRGRPFSKKGPPKQIVAGARNPLLREQQIDPYVTLGDGGGIKTRRKRRRKTQVVAVPHKRTKRAGKVELGDNRDVATKHSSSKRPRKMKRKFAQRTKPMVMRVKGNKDEGVNKPDRREKSSDYKVIEAKDAAEKQDFLTTALDENSNALKNIEGHKGNSCTFTCDAVSLPGDELHGDKLNGVRLHIDELQGDHLYDVELHGDALNHDELQVVELQGDKLQGDKFHGYKPQGDILRKEVGLLPAETMELLQNLGEAQRSGSDLATQNNTLPQGHKSLSDCKLNLKRHNTVLSPVPFNRPWQHEQVDVEGVQQEEEEEEIEVVFYSPLPQLRVWENIQDNMDMLEAGEEKGDDDDGEDLSEVDVTGDEAE